MRMEPQVEELSHLNAGAANLVWGGIVLGSGAIRLEVAPSVGRSGPV